MFKVSMYGSSGIQMRITRYCTNHILKFVVRASVRWRRRVLEKQVASGGKCKFRRNTYDALLHNQTLHGDINIVYSVYISELAQQGVCNFCNHRQHVCVGWLISRIPRIVSVNLGRRRRISIVESDFSCRERGPHGMYRGTMYI